MDICAICDNSDSNQSYDIPEMMLGSGKIFEYFECSSCGCLQIKELPHDLSKYYPSNYLSFSKPHLPKFLLLRYFLLNPRLLYALGENNFMGFLLSKLFGGVSLPNWIERLNLRPESSILDVGCGVGRMLLRLRRKGFTNLMGIDPFIEKNIFYKCGVQVFKKHIEDV